MDNGQKQVLFYERNSSATGVENDFLTAKEFIEKIDAKNLW
jgi:hypothetical protein